MRLSRKNKPTKATYLKSQSQFKKTAKLSIVYGNKTLVAVISGLLIISTVSVLVILQKSRGSKASQLTSFASIHDANWQDRWFYTDSGLATGARNGAHGSLEITLPGNQAKAGINPCFNYSLSNIVTQNTITQVVVNVKGNMAGTTSVHAKIGNADPSRVAFVDPASAFLTDVGVNGANRTGEYQFTFDAVDYNRSNNISICHRVDSVPAGRTTLLTDKYSYVSGFVIKGYPPDPVAPPAPAPAPTPAPTSTPAVETGNVTCKPDTSTTSNTATCGATLQPNKYAEYSFNSGDGGDQALLVKANGSLTTSVVLPGQTSGRDSSPVTFSNNTVNVLHSFSGVSGISGGLIQNLGANKVVYVRVKNTSTKTATVSSIELRKSSTTPVTQPETAKTTGACTPDSKGVVLTCNVSIPTDQTYKYTFDSGDTIADHAVLMSGSGKTTVTLVSPTIAGGAGKNADLTLATGLVNVLQNMNDTTITGIDKGLIQDVPAHTKINVIVTNKNTSPVTLKTIELRKAVPADTTGTKKNIEPTSYKSSIDSPTCEKQTLFQSPTETQVEGMEAYVIDAENANGENPDNGGNHNICVITDQAKNARAGKAVDLYANNSRLSHSFTIKTDGEYAVDAYMRGDLIDAADSNIVPSTFKFNVIIKDANGKVVNSNDLSGQAGVVTNGHIKTQVDAESYARRTINIKDPKNTANKYWLKSGYKVYAVVEFTNDGTLLDKDGKTKLDDRNLILDYMTLRKTANEPTTNKAPGKVGAPACDTSLSSTVANASSLSISPSISARDKDAYAKTETKAGLANYKYINLADANDYVQCSFKLPEGAESGKYVLRASIRSEANGTVKEPQTQKIDLSMAGAPVGIRFDKVDLLHNKNVDYQSKQMSIQNDNPRSMKAGDQVVARLTKLAGGDSKMSIHVEKLQLVKVVDDNGNLTAEVIAGEKLTNTACDNEASKVANGTIRIEAEESSNRDSRAESSDASKCRIVKMTNKNSVMSVQFTIPKLSPPQTKTKYKAYVSAKVTGGAESNVSVDGSKAITGTFGSTLNDKQFGALKAYTVGDKVNVTIRKTNATGSLEVDYIQLVPDSIPVIKTPDNPDSTTVDTGLTAQQSQIQSVVNNSCAKQKSLETTSDVANSEKQCITTQSGDEKVVKLSKDYEYVEHQFAPVKENGYYDLGFTLKSVWQGGDTSRAHRVAKLYVNGKAMKVSGQEADQDTFLVKADAFRLYRVRLPLVQGEKITIRVVFNDPGKGRSLLVQNAMMIRVGTSQKFSQQYQTTQ